MSIETSANPVGVQEDVTVPVLRTFQTLDVSSGHVAENVNLFRGNVTMPLTLLSLENRGGLQADVVLNYQSDVAIDVATWNLERPTSIVGLGWDMPYAMIELDFGGSISPYDDAYYLSSSDGARSRLYRTSRTDDLWTFEAESFDFATIQYFPRREVWQVTDSAGTVQVYGADVGAGGDPALLRYAIKWGGALGNWTGSSVQPGQSYFPISWNLASVRSRWGDEIAFTYSAFPDDAVPVGGPNGLRYTRASYLRTIADPSGRVVSFRYGVKRYDDEAREFVPPHAGPAPGQQNAYQDRYETRYLDSVRVSQTVAGTAEELFTIRFDYTVENLAPPGTPGASRDLQKRYLRGLTTVNANGKLLPGIRFDYYTGADRGDDVHRGALKAVTYPQGGIATYTYESSAVPGTALDRTMKATDPDWVPGIPRYWFGPDYLVITHYEPSSAAFAVCVHAWNGRWLDATPVSVTLASTLDMDTLQVLLRDDFILVTYELTQAGSNGSLQSWAIRRAFGRFGDWDAEALAMPPLTTSTASWQVDAGAGFVVAAAAGVSTIYRYTWHARARQWHDDSFDVDTMAAGEWTLAANEAYFTLCQYQPGMPLSLSLRYLDTSTLGWNDGLPPLDSIQTYVWQDDLPRLSWSTAASYATVAFLSAADQPRNTIDYEVRLYQWDARFAALPSPPPIRRTAPADTKEPVQIAWATDSLVGNVGNLLRYDGVQWNVGSLGTFDEGTDVARFTYGSDIAVGVSTEKGVLAVWNPELGQFVTSVSQTGDWGPSEPTISAPYVTVRNQIYQQQPTGELLLLSQQLPLDATRLVNQAPTYIAYGDERGTSFLWLMRNGVLAPQPIQLSGVLFSPDATGNGTELAGPFAFATYTGASLDQPDQVTLHRVLFQRFTGPSTAFVVTAVTVSDGMGTSASASFDYATPGTMATVNPFGLAVQFGTVKTVLGSVDPSVTPFGYSLSRYLDGMIPDGLPDGTLYTLLNGMLDESVAYAGDAVVARSRRVWTTVREITSATTGATIPLIGAYVRLAQSVDTVCDVDPMSLPAQPPVDVTVTLRHGTANGEVCRRESSYFDADTATYVTVLEENRFAYEQYPELSAPGVNLLQPVALHTKSAGGAVTRIEATTWGTGPGGDVWAPCRAFRARSAGATLSAAEWNNTIMPDVAQWKPLWQVTRRDSRGEIVEYVAADGLSNSVVTDTSQQLVTAAFGNASAEAGQALYLGFESYEDLAGWTLAGSAPGFAAAIAEGDACSGTRSLVLGGATVTGSSPAQRSLRITETAGRAYVLSCWVKSPVGFHSGPGAATWTVTGAAGGDTTVAIPDTAGQWQYLFIPFVLAADTQPQAVTLTLANTREAAMRVDGIRLSPLLAGFSASVYDPRLLQPTASLLTTGSIQRTMCGDFAETRIGGDALETVAKLESWYLSRRGNVGAFSAADPNTRLTIQPQGWGFSQSFALGDVFAGDWTSNTPASWSTSDGSLHHRAGSRDAIAFTGYPELPAGTRNVFGASLRVTPTGALTAPVGMTIGADAFTVAWDPGTGCWSLADGSGTLVTAPLRAALQLSYATYGAALDAGKLPPDFPALFGAAGLPLAASSPVRVAAAGAWRVTDGGGSTVYYLTRPANEQSSIVVTTFAGEWTLLIVGRTLSLFADGGRVMSHDLGAPVARELALFATDAIGYDNAVFYTEPRFQLAFIDGVGNVRQEQVADPSPSDDNRMVARAHVPDALARVVIDSQFAALSPAPEAWGLIEPALATVDWSTMAMTGLVATQNPESGAYPYWRTRFEASPLARKVEAGLPGEAYAITPVPVANHTSRLRYGLNDGSLGVTAGRFARTTVVDGDGATRVTLTDERRNPVLAAELTGGTGDARVWAIARARHDAAGNLVQSDTPMGWSDTFGYDFLGQSTVATRPNEGVTRTMYDSTGRLRFQMTARGAVAPSYIRYWKYDAFSRVIEEGISPQTWDAGLAAHADDQTFPAATPSTSYDYDFAVPALDPLSPLALGRRTRTVSSNQVTTSTSTDTFRSVETVEYDDWAMTVRHTLEVDGESAVYATGYSYDNLGDVTAIQYPGDTGIALAYRYDMAGRITGVAVNGARVAAYTWSHNGLAATETMYDDAGTPVGATRTFAYEPPGWLRATVGSNFAETATFAPASEGTGYYNGTPSTVTTDAREDVPLTVTRFTVDTQGRLSCRTVGQSTPERFTYDANGNLLIAGPATNGYTAATHDLTQTTVAPPDTVTLAYDASGERVSSVGGSLADTLRYDWDGFRDAPLLITRGASPGTASWAMRYGHGGHRVWKEETNDDTGTTTAYLRGAGTDLLGEVVGGVVRQYVRGPLGLVQLRIGGTPFFVARDRMGSNRAVTDANGALLGGYDFQPYGASAGPAFGSNPGILAYRFTDRELESTGLYNFLGRLYDPVQGRFISADPAHEFLSPYIYAGNNPLLLVDPTGDFAFIAFIVAAVEAIVAAEVVIETSIAIGAVLGAVVGVVQGAETIAALNLSGGEAAGAFFGTLVLNTVGGALTAGVAVATTAVAESAAVAIILRTSATAAAAVGLATGATATAGLAAAQGAAQAALVGNDPGDAAWKNAVAAGTSFLVGAAAAAGAGVLAAKTAFKGTTQAVIRGSASGVLSGAAGSATNVLVNGETDDLALSDVLQSMAFGLVGGVLPEVVSYKYSKHVKHVTRLEARLKARPGDLTDADNEFL